MQATNAALLLLYCCFTAALLLLCAGVDGICRLRTLQRGHRSRQEPGKMHMHIRQHTSAYDSIRQPLGMPGSPAAYVSIRQHTSAYVSIRQHTPAYVSIRQHTSAYVRALQRGHRSRQAPGTQFTCFTSTKVQIRQHTPAYVSIRQHTSEGIAHGKRQVRSLLALLAQKYKY
jgi:hypothetical protein